MSAKRETGLWPTTLSIERAAHACACGRPRSQPFVTHLVDIGTLMNQAIRLVRSAQEINALASFRLSIIDGKNQTLAGLLCYTDDENDFISTHGPNRFRYSIEERNALTISALT